MNSVGKYIYDIRNKQQISIRYLARLTGISHSEINKIEKGERVMPSPMHLKTIADVLGINQIELFKIAGYIDENVYLSEEHSEQSIIVKTSEHKEEETMNKKILK